MGYAFALREVVATPYGCESDVGPRPSAGGPAGEGGSPSPFGALAPDLDPRDIDAVERVGDEIALIAAYLHAGMGPYLDRIAWFDRAGGWRHAGHRTCAHCVSYRTGHDLGTAREHVRVARALEGLPTIRAALGRGALSFSQTRALTRVAKPETEPDLLALAEGATVAELERMVRAYRKSSRREEAEEARLRHAERTFSVFPNDRGSYTIEGDVDPETAGVLMRAVDAAGDALYREAKPLPVSPETAAWQAACRRVDALRLVAERALGAGFGADNPKTLSGTRAERYQVLLFVEPGTLAADGEPGMSELEDGTSVSPMEATLSTARRCALPRSMPLDSSGYAIPVEDGGTEARASSLVPTSAVDLFEPIRRLFTYPRSSPHEHGCRRGGPVSCVKAVQTAETLPSSPLSAGWLPAQPRHTSPVESMT